MTTVELHTDHVISASMVGAPIVNLHTGGVWAMLVGRVQREDGTRAVVIPLNQLAPDLREVLELNGDYHARHDLGEHRWPSHF